MDEIARKRLLDMFASGGFDKNIVGLELLSAEDGHAELRIVVTEPLQNLFGSLHGGAVATLVDVAGTVAILCGDRDGRPGVTTDLNVSYLAGAKAGEAVKIDAHALKTGRTLAFVSVDLKREKDGVLLAQGRMTKFMG